MATANVVFQALDESIIIGMKLIAKDDYFGILYEESLLDPLSLNDLKIKFTGVSLSKNFEEDSPIFHLYNVTMTGREVEKLPKLLRRRQFYAKFFSSQGQVIVYPTGIYIINEKTREGLESAYKMGKKLGVGEDHLMHLLSPTRSLSEIRANKLFVDKEEAFLESWLDAKRREAPNP